MKVIGLTGSIGSGKEVLKEFLVKKFPSYYVTLSDIIRAELEKKKKAFDRKALQDQGNEMRRKYGDHILAKFAVEYLSRDKKLIIIDGIRNLGEAEYLKKKFGSSFILIGIDAPREIRFERISKRGEERDPKTFEEFVVLDERDLGLNEPDGGLQVAKCLEIADYKIINDGSLEELQNKISEIVEKI